MKYTYRDWQKRIHMPDTSYFITFYTKNRFPYFKETVLCDLFLENLRICKRLKDFLLFGWVILYEHVHLLLMPRDRWNISEIMHAIKRHTSRDINISLGYTTEPESEDSYPHFREGDCFSLDSTDTKQTLIHFREERYSLFSIPRFLWHKSFHDHYIRNDSDFDYHMEYIDYNPTKHNLPSDWPYVYTNSKYEDLTDNIL